ncbi:putative C globular stage [Hibiscus syriacus]|uniref:C globular stage n=1 Tax=Hibiscus syriacus TaxID=106335 RepID=A0A6A3CPG7_HIBSY|nr:auxin-responsive protein SAUR50-like [Hibiscus syriacus]KAE8730374.1 putative C globular stage [Hibiscus syriacus]
MPNGVGKCQKISHIVRIRHMLKKWRRKARMTANSNLNRKGQEPFDVPAGHVVVCVGTGLRRYLVRATYLNHPIFKKLLVQAEEEYGFNNVGPLTIPCSESFFEEILRLVSRSDSSSSNSGRSSFSTFEDFQRRCRLGLKNKRESFSGPRPVFHPVADRSVY